MGALAQKTAKLLYLEENSSQRGKILIEMS